MIPKIIHYIWLGKSEMPIEVRDCIKSWQNNMPDYELMFWDDDAISEFRNPFIIEALEQKKYAFATDVIRLYALQKYGGIYLDTDVKVLKSFDDFLHHHAFIGRESCMQISFRTTSYHLTSYCLGAEKNNEYINKCINYCKGRHFVLSNEDLPNHLKYDMQNASYVFSEIATLFGYNPSTLAPDFQNCYEDVLTVFPSYYFAEGIESDKAYCKHLSLGSWRDFPQDDIIYDLKYKIEWRIKSCMESFLNRLGYIMLKKN